MRRFIGIMILMAFVSGCDDNLDDEIAENSKKIVHGAASVKQMAKNCETPTDYSGDKEASGTYSGTNGEPSVVPYPRRSSNIIVDKLKWQPPIKTQFTIENNHGNLKVKLKLLGQEELEGKIYAPQGGEQRVCFFGPVQMAVEGVTTEAYFYADGSLTGNPPTVLDLDVNLGVTVTIPDKTPQHWQFRQNFHGELQEQKNGLFINFHQGERNVAAPYVEREVALKALDQGGEVLVARKLKPRESRVDGTLPERVELRLPTQSGSYTALRLTFNKNGAPVTEIFDDCSCDLEEGEGIMLKGNFTCYKSQGPTQRVRGQFTIVEPD